jgi:hypothetical protein
VTANFLLIVGPWLLAGLLLLVRLRTGRETPLRPVPSNVRVIGRSGQPGKNEGEHAGLVGRGRPASPSSPPIDFDREADESCRLTRSDPECLRRLRLIVGDGRRT